MPISLLHVQHFSSGILNSKIKTKQRAVATEHCAEEKKQKNKQKKQSAQENLPKWNKNMNFCNRNGMMNKHEQHPKMIIDLG